TGMGGILAAPRRRSNRTRRVPSVPRGPRHSAPRGRIDGRTPPGRPSRALGRARGPPRIGAPATRGTRGPAPANGRRSFMPATRRSPRLAALSTLLAALSLVAGALPVRAQMYPHKRVGWFLGATLGGGSAALSVGGASTDREGAPTGSFRAGYDFS